MLQKHAGIDPYIPGKPEVSISSELHILWLHMSSPKVAVGGGIYTAEVSKRYRSGNLKTVISVALSDLHIKMNCDRVVSVTALRLRICASFCFLFFYFIHLFFLQSSTVADQKHTNLGTYSAVCLRFVVLWHSFWDSDWQDKMCVVTWIPGICMWVRWIDYRNDITQYVTRGRHLNTQ